MFTHYFGKYRKVLDESFTTENIDTIVVSHNKTFKEDCEIKRCRFSVKSSRTNKTVDKETLSKIAV